MSTVGANNASDIGLIVQGTLIFLSAIVAVFGYIVQGKLKSKEQKREHEAQQALSLSNAKLDRVREQIRTFVGPAFSFAMSSHMQIVTELCPLEFLLRFANMRPRKTLWTVSNGAIEKYFNEQPNESFTFQKYFKSKSALFSIRTTTNVSCSYPTVLLLTYFLSFIFIFIFMY